MALIRDWRKWPPAQSGLRPGGREKQKERSDRARRAVNIRWERYHAQRGLEQIDVVIPDPCYRLTVENLIVGDSHLLEFHPTDRLNRFRICVDGHDWSICGWSMALAKIRKSCVRMRRID
jgi:hypothetical protein